MHVRPSHSALDELLDLPSALEAQAAPYGVDDPFEAVQHDQSRDQTGTRGAPDTHNARLPAALWLPAPGSDCDSEQRLKQSAALRQRDWPTSTSGVVWVGEASGVEVCCVATSGSEDRNQCYAAAPPTSAPGQGRRSKAAGRPCYQIVMKVGVAGGSGQKKACCSYRTSDCARSTRQAGDVRIACILVHGAMSLSRAEERGFDSHGLCLERHCTDNTAVAGQNCRV